MRPSSIPDDVGSDEFRLGRSSIVRPGEHAIAKGVQLVVHNDRVYGKTTAPLNTKYGHREVQHVFVMGTASRWLD